MNLTKALKEWTVAHCGIKSTATDGEFRTAVGVAIASGALPVEKFTELSVDEAAKAAVSINKQLAALAENVEKLSAIVMGGSAVDAKGAQGAQTDVKSGSTVDVKGGVWHQVLGRVLGGDTAIDQPNQVRVKGAYEAYSTTKSVAVFPTHTKAGRAHPLAGKPIMDFSEGQARVMDNPSDLDKAVCGAFAKFLCATAQRGGSRTFGFQSLSDHDKGLLVHAMDQYTWGGATDGGDYADIRNRKLTEWEVKALIDDATSGGLEAAPIVFDDQVIQTPLLHGELFPLVTQIPLDRGRRIEGVATGTVTSSWGGVDDTAVSLFNTASYVSAFDTTVFRWEGAIKIGLDFLSDTPIDFGRHVTEQYGERLLEDLDDVIAVGNGTTQPEGVMNKSGTTSVSFSGSTTIGGYESLRFGVAKQEHRSTVAASAVFCGTETSYSRVKALPVGASDARRIFNNAPFGTTGYDGYAIMDRPYKINGSLTNAQIFYAILARYRMYRRRGLTMRSSREGDTLIRNNELLMVATARYGGQLERGACAAKTTNAPA